MRARHLLLVAVAAAAAIAIGVGITETVLRSRAQMPSMHATGIADIGGPFSLVDDTGHKVTQASLKGKPSVFYFGYTFCPEVCPTTLTDLSRWIRALGPDADKINFIFVTVDPQRDTVAVMHKYVTSFNRHIRGFTGTPAEIAKIAKEYRVYYKRVPSKGGGYLINHTALLYLMGPHGKFVDTIAYQEKDSTALAKLRHLAAMISSS